MKRVKDYPPILRSQWSWIIGRHNHKSHAWGGAEWKGQLLTLCGKLIPKEYEQPQFTEIQCKDCIRYLHNRVLYVAL